MRPEELSIVHPEDVEERDALFINNPGTHDVDAWSTLVRMYYFLRKHLLRYGRLDKKADVFYSFLCVYSYLTRHTMTVGMFDRYNDVDELSVFVSTSDLGDLDTDGLFNVLITLKRSTNYDIDIDVAYDEPGGVGEVNSLFFLIPPKHQLKILNKMVRNALLGITFENYIQLKNRYVDEDGVDFQF